MLTSLLEQDQPMSLTHMLASVTGIAEAETVVRAGADIVDLKDPSTGALGALPLDVVRDVAAAVNGRVPVSATIGDLPADPDRVLERVAAVAATGVDYVKVGLFGDVREAKARNATARALGALAREGIALVAVLMADRAHEFSLIATLSRAGFKGVMFDTASKPGASPAPGLCATLSIGTLARFVRTTREAGMLVGLAGSLRVQDVPALLPLEPDLLGFRGALCEGGRSGALDAARLARVRAAIPAAGVRAFGTRASGAPNAAA